MRYKTKPERSGRSIDESKYILEESSVMSTGLARVARVFGAKSQAYIFRSKPVPHDLTSYLALTSV